jgi:hypothetical protein
MPISISTATTLVNNQFDSSYRWAAPTLVRAIPWSFLPPGYPNKGNHVYQSQFHQQQFW